MPTDLSVRDEASLALVHEPDGVLDGEDMVVSASAPRSMRALMKLSRLGTGHSTGVWAPEGMAILDEPPNLRVRCAQRRSEGA